MSKRFNVGDTLARDGESWTITDIVPRRDRVEVHKLVSGSGERLDMEVSYDNKGNTWMYRDVTCESQFTDLPLTEEDIANGVDEKSLFVDEKGKEWIVEVIYNTDPDAPTLEQILADMLLNNYYTASRMFGIYVPHLEGTSNNIGSGIVR